MKHVKISKEDQREEAKKGSRHGFKQTRGRPTLKPNQLDLELNSLYSQTLNLLHYFLHL